MNKKLILVSCLVIGLLIGAIVIFRLTGSKIPLSTPLITQQKPPEKKQPSPTFKEYTDPSGFTLSYPDNLSLTKNETDNNTYADIQLNSKDVNGSLSLKITDSQFKSLDDWLKQNKISSNLKPKEVKLGNLPAWEIRLNDRLILGALDKEIFFNIEMPLVDQDFWQPVYQKILANFSFASPETAAESESAGSSDDVSFEGEEVVE